jgi:PAS domain S-box-containing protein
LFGYGVHPGRIKVKLSIDNIFLDVETAIPCGLIINELISNALKHAFPNDRPGEINITFTHDQDVLILVISDNGFGFSEDVDFKKSKSLGLQLVNTLIHQLMGQITLDKSADSSFTLKFCHASKYRELPIMLAHNILIVEDEGIIAMDLRNQLEDFGYEVVATAFSGGQAISLAVEHQPDLIMMDIVLKGNMDGISAAQSITESMDIPIIFLTSYSDSATIKRAKTVGAYGYLIKPFRPDELHSSIEVALYKHQLERKLKDSEQWFAKTLHCISDAVIATNTEGKIQFMNPVAEMVTGCQLDQIEGIYICHLMTLLTESDRTIIENPALSALKTRSVTGLDHSTLLVTQAKGEIPIDDGAAPIIDDNGCLLGAVLVFRDITDRRHIENQLRESEERFPLIWPPLAWPWSL